MENAKCLLDEVNLYGFDPDDDGLHERRPQTSDLLIDWREPEAQGKTLSCSEFDDAIFSANDLIRAHPRFSKGRSHSDNDGAPKISIPPPPSFVPPKPKSDRRPAAVPPKLERRQNDDEATKILNGYIFHENVATLVEVENRQDIKHRQIQDDDDSSSSSDEVFHLSKNSEDLLFRKPLLPSSASNSRKRVHFAKGSERVTISSSPTMELLDARVKRGRSWRSRLICLSYFLVANLLAGSLVLLVLYMTGTLSVTKLPGGVCSTTVVELHKNLTLSTDHLDFVLVAGHSRIIHTADGRPLFLIPYIEECNRCNAPSGGIAAFNVETLEIVWHADSEGQVDSFVCGDDLNNDQISDCVFTTVSPVTLEIISGADGARLTRVQEMAGPRRIFAPVFIPDANGDFIADLLVTLEDTTPGQKLVEIFVLASKPVTGPQVNSYERYRLFTVTNTTVKHPAVLWRSGNDEFMVAASFTNQAGLYLWSLTDALRGRVENRIIRHHSTLFGAPLGVFTELNGDGAPELISCLEDGSVRAFTQSSVLWTYAPGKKSACVPSSLALGRLASGVRPGIALSVTNLTDDTIQTIVLDGKSGQPVHAGANSSSKFDSSPLILSVSGAKNQDQILHWRLHDSKVQLVATGYPWLNISILYETAAIGSDQKLTSEEDLYRVQLLNQRLTGSLFGSEGRATFLFATNSKTKTIVVHKLVLACKCHLDQCGTFSDGQIWPSFRATSGDGYLV